MIPLSIGSATKVYGNASRCEIFRHWVDHPLLADVSRSLRALVQSLGDEATDDYWRQTLGLVRKLAFSSAIVPLPFAQAAVSVGIDWAKVNRQVRLCQQMFPDSHESLANLVQKLERLSAEPGSPLIGPLEDLLRQCGSLWVMIRNPRMNQAAAAYFAGNANLRNARVVSAIQTPGRSYVRRAGSDRSLRLVPRICILCSARRCDSCDFFPLDSRRLEARADLSSQPGCRRRQESQPPHRDNAESRW